MIGYLNLPLFTNSLTSPSTWINQVLAALSYATVNNTAEALTAAPSIIIPGKLYLIRVGFSGANPGDAIVYLDNTAASAIVLSFPDNVVFAGYTKNSSDWIRNIFSNGGTIILNTAGAYPLPTTFNGLCNVIVTTTGVSVITTGSRTSLGKIATVLPVGVYNCYQDSDVAVI